MPGDWGHPDNYLLLTDRLELIPATLRLCAAEAAGAEALGRVLQARIPQSWPPTVFESDDVARLRRRLRRAPRTAAWVLHYLVLRLPSPERDLLGVAGYGGPPSASGEVDIGYAVAVEHQGKGYTTEAVRALIAHAFADPRVRLLRATTFPHLLPSIGVLRKTGFRQLDGRADSGLITFHLERDRTAAVYSRFNQHKHLARSRTGLRWSAPTGQPPRSGDQLRRHESAGH